MSDAESVFSGIVPPITEEEIMDRVFEEMNLLVRRKQIPAKVLNQPVVKLSLKHLTQICTTIAQERNDKLDEMYVKVVNDKLEEHYNSLVDKLQHHKEEKPRKEFKKGEPPSYVS